MVPAGGGDDVGFGLVEELFEGSSGPVEVFIGVEGKDPAGSELVGCHMG